MNTPLVRIIGVGTSDALRQSRRDERVELIRCADAHDALASAMRQQPAPDALVFDALAASHEDMPMVSDAAVRSGLPAPIVLDRDQTLEDLLHRLSTSPPAHGACPSQEPESVAMLHRVVHALLEERSTLKAFLADRSVEELEARSDDLAATVQLLDRLDRAQQALRDTGHTDAHTGLPDRNGLTEAIRSRIADAYLARTPFTLRLIRLSPQEQEDPIAIHAHTQRAQFAGVVSWGVLGLVLSGDHQGPRTPERADAIYPWDAVDAQDLLNLAQSRLAGDTRTNGVS